MSVPVRNAPLSKETRTVYDRINPPSDNKELAFAGSIKTPHGKEKSSAYRDSGYVEGQDVTARNKRTIHGEESDGGDTGHVEDHNGITKGTSFCDERTSGAYRDIGYAQDHGVTTRNKRTPCDMKPAGANRDPGYAEIRDVTTRTLCNKNPYRACGDTVGYAEDHGVTTRGIGISAEKTSQDYGEPGFEENPYTTASQVGLDATPCRNQENLDSKGEVNSMDLGTSRTMSNELLNAFIAAVGKGHLPKNLQNFDIQRAFLANDMFHNGAETLAEPERHFPVGNKHKTHDASSAEGKLWEMARFCTCQFVLGMCGMLVSFYAFTC